MMNKNCLPVDPVDIVVWGATRDAVYLVARNCFDTVTKTEVSKITYSHTSIITNILVTDALHGTLKHVE